MKRCKSKESGRLKTALFILWARVVTKNVLSKKGAKAEFRVTASVNLTFQSITPFFFLGGTGSVMLFERCGVERWMDKYEKSALYDLAETCSLSISLKSLLQWSKEDGEPGLEESEVFQKAGHGHINGLPKLRENIAALYSKDSGIDSDCIISTQGAIGANFLAMVFLVNRGDRVVCVAPTYQQLQQLPKTFGADVSLWNLHPDGHWEHDVEELRKLLTPKTSLVFINNPNNPTGTIISTHTLGLTCKTVETVCPSAIILCDEVYRPLFHSLSKGQEAPCSILELGFPNVIATGSLSKAFSLAGLRVEWIATQERIYWRRFSVLETTVSLVLVG